ncbi:Cytochrome b5 [Phytophthora citrophthora]|uniref:Cytochrome b5 n=1 Tax=Phytophthora citrophthora TaxID=4793 RepID=A0AAD9LSM7_9STRA|nr:Cytochrome b5 [Phytophthora citrophthora]
MSSSSAAVSTGNRVAQFIVITAVISVLYQLLTRPTSSLSSTASSLGSGYRKGEDSRRFTSSEITGFLLFMGLFGLLQHKKKQDKKADIEAEQRQIARIVQIQRNSLKNGLSNAPGASVINLPRDILHELLLFLSPRDLATCPIVCKAWELNVGDAADALWRRVFKRDFCEPGERFRQVFPIECWRQFYFRHHLSRAVEIARLLGITDNRKCVAIEGQVYDVTDFLDLHPGGPHVIGDAVGTDATEIWDQFRHSDEAKESMQEFLVHDEVLARPESEKLHGNLESVVARWRKISWALAHSHCFGRMAPQFANAIFRFHSRGITSVKVKREQLPA